MVHTEQTLYKMGGGGDFKTHAKWGHPPSFYKNFRALSNVTPPHFINPNPAQTPKYNIKWGGVTPTWKPEGGVDGAAPRSGASTARTRSSRGAARKSCWCSARRSVAAGTQQRSTSFATSSASELSAHRPQCVAPRPLGVCRGPARGCKHSLGALVASRPSAGAGRRPSTGTVCSTSPLTRRPAACPCGPKPGPHVVI